MLEQIKSKQRKKFIQELKIQQKFESEKEERLKRIRLGQNELKRVKAPVGIENQEDIFESFVLDDYESDTEQKKVEIISEEHQKPMSRTKIIYASRTVLENLHSILKFHSL
jgi:hypothetical protein